ncbi:putative GNAT family acetyltransferase [Xylariaceae sp. FL1272]|nr:putative GNAT family acetyltransferase [Xylariaceae sp. FL1272]
MPLVLSLAEHADAPRIAEIHMAAFGSNKMLRAQFPMPDLRQALQDCIEKKALADMDDSKTTVLVVSITDDPEERKLDIPSHQSAAGIQNRPIVIAFAKWAHPVNDHEAYVEPPWIWPEGIRMDVLDAWSKQTDEAQMKAVGTAPCYRLPFIGTDPCYERRGAASLLIEWGKERCELDKVPGYLESTVEAADLYAKHGFTSVDKICLDITDAATGDFETYTEISFVFNAESSTKTLAGRLS